MKPRMTIDTNAFDPTRTITPPALPSAETQVRALISDVEKRAAAADKGLRVFVEKHPLAALAGAVAAGFVFGRIVSRF